MKIAVVALTLATLWSNINADYIAAVVEYGPLSSSTPNSTVETNLNEYLHYIELAKRNNVQIIVFPEYGLTGLVDDPTDYAIEIPNASNGPLFQNYWLQSLSNAATEHSMYVVVNLLEKASNENNETIYYNTNVVFDNTGIIVAKYRKINLYFEPKLTPGNETVTFTTNFGITFAIFTCFDMLYYHPSRSVLNNVLTDVIFPSAWTVTLPFYHTLSIQSGYALGNQVNLLAANLNSPSQGISGSGIYASDGSVISYYLSGTSSSRLLIASLRPRGVPRVDDSNPFSTFGFDILGNDTTPQSDLRNLIISRDFQSTNYQFKQLDLSQENIQATLCYDSLCCSFNLSTIDANKSEIYKLLVYDGPTKLGNSEGNIKVCTVIACETVDTSSCGSRNVSLTTKFKYISITGNLEHQYGYFYQPISWTSNLLPVFNTTFNSVDLNETISVNFNTTQVAENVVVYGILGRGAASSLGSSFIFLIVISILKYLV